jgi:transcriptional regulator with XRE-family HTH domain
MKEQIKALRTSKGLSREKLGNLCGLTGQTIYRAEKSGKITLNNYQKIIKALNDYDYSNNSTNSL